MRLAITIEAVLASGLASTGNAIQKCAARRHRARRCEVLLYAAWLMVSACATDEQARLPKPSPTAIGAPDILEPTQNAHAESVPPPTSVPRLYPLQRGGYSFRFKPSVLTINFIETDLRDIVQSMFFDVIGVEYAIHPAVTGKVTFGPQVVSSEELPAMIAGWLRKNCATMVQEGQSYQIIPISYVPFWASTHKSTVELPKQFHQRTRSDDQQRINEIGAVGFATVAAARETITVLPGATVRDMGGRTEIVDESDGVTHWAFSPNAVFKMVIKKAPDGTLEAKPSGALCERGSQRGCEALLSIWTTTFRIDAEYAQARAAGCPSVPPAVRSKRQ